MPELRTDWLTGRSVIVAENRALRPNEFAVALSPTYGEVASATGPLSVAQLTLAEAGLPSVPGVPKCPFCVGNESRTPPSVYERTNQAGKWLLRVVPNMFPAVAFAEDDDPRNKSGAGAHEVIVEINRHIDRTSELTQEEFYDVLLAYAARLCHWRNDGRLAYGLVFKNQGPRAGASISHLHSQLIALPAMPPAVSAELARAEQHDREHHSCPYCQLIEQERSFGKRIVEERDGFITFCPNASLQPHEVWLLPVAHQHSFEGPDAAKSYQQLAGVLHDLIGRLEAIVPSATYNMLLRTAPWKVSCGDWFHWRIELLPRVNSIAGMEIATGMHINPLPPERAAGQLRPT